jgi:hypothetical protein
VGKPDSGLEDDMTDERDPTKGDQGQVTEVPREEWPSWCARATADHSGKVLVLHRIDRARGEVRLAEGQQFVAVEHEEFGTNETLTIKYGTGAVPVSYVIFEPQAIRQHRDEAGDVQEVSITDATGRRTLVSLA